jgi:hypothetical protein
MFAGLFDTAKPSEGPDIVAAFARRREFSREDAQAIVKVLTEGLPRLLGTPDKDCGNWDKWRPATQILSFTYVELTVRHDNC